MGDETMREAFIYALKAILMPACWVRPYAYNRFWDRRLRSLLRSHRFVRATEHTAILGNVRIWIGNHPYASFSPNAINCLPARATALYAMDRMIVDLVESECAASIRSTIGSGE